MTSVKTRFKRVLLLFLTTNVVISPVGAQVEPGLRDYWPTAGWQTADPQAQGTDPAMLTAADARVRNELPYLTSMLAVRGGDLVFERYYGELAEGDTVQIWSATKSITSTLVGIAVAEGLLTLDQTVGDLLPARLPLTADPRAAGVTVRQLLTMTSGFAWESSTDYQFAFDEVDLTARTLGLPMACDPGACYEYNSGNVQVLASMVEAVSGMTQAEYAQPRLFEPLGIAPPVWEATVTGETLGAVGLYLTPRDFAKIGYLYLNQGVWDGKQIVPAEWVAAATTEQSSGANATGVNLGQAGYGYLWWVTEVGGLPAFFALGLGSQMLYVVPALDLVIVATTSNAIPYTVPIQEQQDPRPIIEDLIVRAATGPVAVTAEPAAPAASITSPGALPLPAGQAAMPGMGAAGAIQPIPLPRGRVLPEMAAYQQAAGDVFMSSNIVSTTGDRVNRGSEDVALVLAAHPRLDPFGFEPDEQVWEASG